MVLMENPYGEKCINRTDVKKISRKICEKCPRAIWVGRTFSTCHLDTNTTQVNQDDSLALQIDDKMDVGDPEAFEKECEEMNKHIEDYV